mgnify:CR=1 FL=1
MKTILVCNQKGGVGKSLVADEIAFSFERSGIPVSFYDLDAQGGTLHRTQEADGAQVAVVDTPGALQEALSEWLKEADVVVRRACGRPDGGHASPVRGVRAGGRCRRVRGRVRPQGQGREGDAHHGRHGARGCGVPEGIIAGQSRVPYGQIEAQGV